MKRVLFVLVGALLLAGCGTGAGKKNSDNQAASGDKPAAPAKLVAGDTVVAKWAQNSFYEGTVESLTDQKAKVKWSDGSSPSEVDLSEVYALPKPGSKPEIKAGDVVVVKTSATGTSWAGAEVVTVGDVVEATLTVGGSKVNVAPDRVIKVTAVSAADLKKQSATTDLTDQAKAKSPAIPAGYKPAVGETVLGEWTPKSWYEGKVLKVTGGRPTIAWSDKTAPSEVASRSVMPLPKAGAAKMPVADQFLLIKPTSGSHWEFARTVSVAGQSVEVKTVGGQARTVKPGEFVLLN